MRRFEIYLDNTWHDVTSLYISKSFSISDQAFNKDRKSVVSSCSFMLRFNQRLHDAVIDSTTAVPVRVWKDIDIEFDGQMDPVFSVSWLDNDSPSNLSVECVDFSVKLDEYITQSASYPAVVDGPTFWIWKSDEKDMSLLYRILQLAGLAERIDRDVPDIRQKIKHMAWNRKEVTYREIIDSLLADYGYCLIVRGEKISWIPTARAEIDHVDEIKPEDIIGSVKKDKDYNTENGVTVSWPKTKVMDDALLWRGNLPIGDTSDPFPGEAIASGDYWPEDSDVIETWQSFGTEYLDTDWLEGNTRIKNNEITLISSSDQYLTDSKDDGVAIDPIDADHQIVYEALRARLRYKNNGSSAKKLYYARINGKALVKTHKIETSYPEDCSDPKGYESTYIYDKDSAERLTQIRWMWLSAGCFKFTFTSTRKLEKGEYYQLVQRPVYDGFIQIVGYTETDGSPLISYTAYSTVPFTEVKPASSGSQGSGSASPGQDGSSPRFIYKRAYNKPATPVGEHPVDWTFDRIPDGTGPVWMSMGQFSSNGNLKGDWTEPVRVNGIDNGAYRGASDTFPSDPNDGDWILYTGPTGGGYQQYHIYKFVAVDERWVETIESDKVMALQKDALQIAKDTGTLIYAALIFVELLVARKLMVGGGDLQNGLLVRFMDDDGSGKPVIEVRYNGEKLFWIDPDTGKMYGNFTRVVQYLPYTFNDSLDPSHPAVFDFFVPDGEIEWAKLSIKGQPYRTYSAVGSAIIWDNNSPSLVTMMDFITIPGISAHSHDFSIDTTVSVEGSGPTSTGSAGNPAHSHPIGGILGSSIKSSGSLKATGTTSLEGGSDSKTVRFDKVTGINADHYHDTDVRIFESNTTPNVFTYALNNGNGFNSTTSIQSGARDVAIPISGSGWKSIKIYCSQIARIQIQIMIKMRIDTTTY